jgi:anti-sigma-K factor RsiG
LATGVPYRKMGSVIEVRPGGRRRIDRVLAPEYVAGLERLDLTEVRARRDDAAQEETDLSYLRRLLHGRIDIVKAEQKRRAEGGSNSVVERLVEILSDNAVGPAPAGSGRHQPLEPSRAEAHRRHVEALVSDADLSDVGSLPAERLDLALRTYAEEEASVSQRRREVQQVVDLLNDEIGSRYRAGSASVDRLLAAERGEDPTD